MKKRFILRHIFICLFIFQPLQGITAQAGLNQFTELDSVGKWTIEQKFTPEENKIECRASIKGYGTWFGARIRLDGNDEVLIPEDVLYKNKFDISDSLIEVRKALLSCRSGLLYIQS